MSTAFMIDIESFDTVATMPIVEIGAVRFDTETGVVTGTFEQAVDLDSNINLGRLPSHDTIAWWMRQPDDARALFQKPTAPLVTALMKLSRFIDPGNDPDLDIWANGSHFDIAALDLAYRQVGMRAPWKFWMVRDLRTLASLRGAHMAERPRPTVAHSALADATAQAQWLVNILRCLQP